MRAFLTGGTGFIGSHLARTLIDRGWNVVALSRTNERAKHLEAMGVRVSLGDITDAESLVEPVYGCDAVFHLAAIHAYGVTDRQMMAASNVRGTRNVLDAAVAAGIPRIIHCSTVAALGAGEPGEIRSETSTHPDRFPSAYEETKWEAHQLAHEFIRDGAPIVVVMPSAVYGAGDMGPLSMLMRFYARGWMLAMPRMNAALSWVHVDDVASGIALAYEKGRAGEDYILGGDNAAIGDLLARLEPVTGIRPPRFTIPDVALSLVRPVGPLIARVLRQPPRFLEEGLDSLQGSYMVSSAKAEEELGYSYRSIEDGMGEMVRWAKEH
jgi:dihydroflavonol-4-reductase